MLSDLISGRPLRHQAEKYHTRPVPGEFRTSIFITPIRQPSFSGSRLSPDIPHLSLHGFHCREVEGEHPNGLRFLRE